MRKFAPKTAHTTHYNQTLSHAAWLRAGTAGKQYVIHETKGSNRNAPPSPPGPSSH